MEWWNLSEFWNSFQNLVAKSKNLQSNNVEMQMTLLITNGNRLSKFCVAFVVEISQEVFIRISAQQIILNSVSNLFKNSHTTCEQLPFFCSFHLFTLCSCMLIKYSKHTLINNIWPNTKGFWTSPLVWQVWLSYIEPVSPNK